MDFKIQVGWLLKDELEYELRIRGITETDTVCAMRRMLRQLMRLTDSSSFMMPAYPFTYQQDVDAVQSKLAAIIPNITAFSGNRRSSEYTKLSSSLAYLFNRVNRIKAEGSEQEAQRSAFIVKIVELSSRLISAAKTVERSSTIRESILDISAVNLGAETSPVDELSSEEEAAAAMPSTSRGVVSPETHIKTVPVSSWGIKFTGNPKDLSVGAFLERVEELKIARHSSEAILFSSAVDLFSGTALTWYRANKNNFASWKELVWQLKIEFLTPDHDDKLFDEIKRRTQGITETIGIYVSVMKGLFSRLSVAMPEATQLKIVLRNLLPFYQTQFGLLEITSFTDLVIYGRKLEARKASVEAYVPPPVKGKSLEPDLAYVSAEPAPRVAPKTSRASRPKVSSAVSALICWNCQREGHRSVQCTAPRKLHCFKCGKDNVTVRTCPSCSGNGQRTQ